MESVYSYLEAASCLTCGAEVPSSSTEQAEEAVRRETRLSGLPEQIFAAFNVQLGHKLQAADSGVEMRSLLAGGFDKLEGI